MKKLPYSNLFEDRLYDMLSSVNECLADNIKELSPIEAIEVSDPEDGKNLMVKMTLKDGSILNKKLSRYVDESALELDSTYLQAFWGLSERSATEYAENFSLDDLKKNEPTVYLQLRREYILSTMPHNDGGEFLEQDKEDILSLL